LRGTKGEGGNPPLAIARKAGKSPFQGHRSVGGVGLPSVFEESKGGMSSLNKTREGDRDLSVAGGR